MSRFLLLLVLGVHLNKASVIVDSPTSIINGHLTSIEEYPFFAYITMDNKFHCGGAILKENLILTAAHCLEKDYENLVVFVGIDSVDQLTDAKPYKVQKKITNDEYIEEREYVYDMGVALLEENILLDSNKIALGVLAAKSPPKGTDVAVIGFGKIKCELRLNACKNGDSDHLRYAIVTIKRIDDKGVLYTKGDGQNTCEGDSGSPVMYDGQIIAVVSGGENLSCTGNDIQAPVAPHLSWLQGIMESY